MARVPTGAWRARLSSRRQGRRGQAMLESMLMMVFTLLLIFGFMHLTMFVVTRYVANYAAYAAARAAMVGNSPEAAARAVMANLNWYAWQGGEPDVTVSQSGGRFVVETYVPFGLPIYRSEDIDGDGIRIRAYAPVMGDDDPPTGGDDNGGY